MSDLARVEVVGCGLMGSGIAEVCARAGRDVVVVETGPAAAEAGLRRVTRSLERAAAGRPTVAEQRAAAGRIAVTTDMARLADRDLVVEAVAEDERAKTEVFARAMTSGCAHPLGPLALADLIGPDTVQAIARSMYAEYREPLYAPPPFLARMVEAGRLGRKTGRGFHPYPGRLAGQDERG
ncbi:3-hydroxyacyl-CoA dehydrogenase NAD-binding domain-containing protein [Streptomyces sp. NPDC020472]|uniref:3-hydroxyacyl-CoA dehydrogenase NAD-binding domain-containing protein n=1 Tax=Streptomyces sp. NPDC020472 TaxID=3365075 RepID=UPI00378B2C89